MTVGIGILLPNSSSAAIVPFRYNVSGQIASEADIIAEFDVIAALEWGRAAAFYKPYTHLHISESVIDDLKRQHVRDDFAGLIGLYPYFGNLPQSVQLALLDMLYNLGLPEFSGYRLMRQAILSEDWEKAARQSHRQGIQEERNDYVKNLFLQAAP